MWRNLEQEKVLVQKDLRAVHGVFSSSGRHDSAVRPRWSSKPPERESKADKPEITAPPSSAWGWDSGLGSGSGVRGSSLGFRVRPWGSSLWSGVQVWGPGFDSGARVWPAA